MTSVTKAWLYFLSVLTTAFLLTFTFFPELIFARNINEYKNTISDSAPLAESNHTLSFILNTTIGPGAYFEITPPDDFEVSASTTVFSAERNVELLVNGAPRVAGSFLDASTDLVEITPGIPGLIKYTLNTTTGITSGSRLQIKIGNHTSGSLLPETTFSTSTGTTTSSGDGKPITNGPTTGTKKFQVDVYDGGLVADAGFLISLVDQVGLGPIDTTEEIPPDRFNGAPSSTITGVSLNVEIFLETNELAICKYSATPGADYFAMTNNFTNTGTIYHTVVVPVTPDSVQQFYVRCIDDEGNFNIDDYLIEFAVSAVPTGESNTEGDVDGDGTGTGNDGTGDGGGAGGQTGVGGGQDNTTGLTTGSGGSGGGGGGGSGGSSGSTAGGGFETTDGPYRSGDGRVLITGYAYPRSVVYALVDGKEAENVRAGNDGQYSVTIDLIARGVYTFGVYAIDSANTRSSTFSTSFTVIGARTSALSNINLAPTLKATPDPVDPGAQLVLSGFALPGATVSVENEKDKSPASKQAFSTTADNNGAWSVNVNTSNFSNGTYKARVKSDQGGIIISNFSNYVFYGVGQNASRPINADLNRDGKVNLVDFSILLFWWNSDGGTSDPSADINSDSRVNLTDFSILLFNWTG